MEENKKIYKRIYNRKLAIPLVILVSIFSAIIMLTQTSIQNTIIKILPFYGIAVVAFNLIGIKKDSKRLEEIGGVSAEEKKEVDMALKRYRKKVVIIAIAVFVAFMVIFSIFMFLGSGKGDDISTCGSCGRSYTAGDADGNYMSIAKSGLCKNCNSNRENFEWIFD